MFVLVSRTRYTHEYVKQQKSEDNVIMKCLTTDDLHGVLLVLLHNKLISYLGSQMNQTNSISSEIQARILSRNRCYYAYGKLMKSIALTL